MTQLPFLVEYGDLVWKVLAVLAAGAAIAMVRRWHARWARRATACELAARAEATTAPVEGVATVRGTLRGGRASSVSLLYLRGRKPYYDERDAELWLDCEGQRVTLVGPVRVVRGTQLVSTRDRRSGLPHGERAARSSPVLHRLAAMTTSVREGDVVFVTAQLTARPAAEAMGYREAATAWTATPYGDAIEVIAAEPAVHAMPLGPARTIASGLVGAAAMVVGLWAVGAAAMAWTTATERKSGELVPAVVGELDAASLAAATPRHGDEALAAIERRLATEDVRTVEAFALRRTVARLRGGCGAEIRARIAQDEIDGLAPLAKHCKDDRAAAEAYQLLGMFQEAVARSSGLPPGEQPIESLLAARVWWRAALWARARRAAAIARAEVGPGRPGALDCAAEWWSRLGGTDVDGWMARAPFIGGDPACAVFAALAGPGTEQDKALANVDQANPGVRRIADALAWARGAPAAPGMMPPAREMHAALFDAVDRMTVAHALLSEPASQNASYTAAEPLLETVAWRSVLATLNEDIGIARTRVHRLAEQARLPMPMDCFQARTFMPGMHGRALELAIALRFRTPIPPSVVDEGARSRDAVRDGSRAMYWDRVSDHYACDRPELGDVGRFRTAVLRAEREGDARDMASLLARCRVRNQQVLEAVFAVWPRVHQGRDELAEVLRRFDLGPAATDPLAVIGRAALRRDVARMVGDDRTADAWAAVIDRHMEAFLWPPQRTALVTRELVRAADDP